MTSQTTLAPQYNSDDEFVELSKTFNSVRAKSKTWILIETFNDKFSATEFIKNEKIWSYDFRNHTNEGDKVYYRCRTVNSHTIKCPASIHLLYDSTGNRVQLFKTNDEHDHDGKCISKQSKVTDDVMQRIKQMFEDGKKPKFIRVLYNLVMKVWLFLAK